MKRFLIALAVLLSIQVADAQVKSPAAAKKSLEAAKEAAENPKKNTKVATWTKLASAYMDAYNAPYGNYLVNTPKMQLMQMMIYKQSRNGKPGNHRSKLRYTRQGVEVEAKDHIDAMQIIDSSLFLTFIDDYFIGGRHPFKEVGKVVGHNNFGLLAHGCKVLHECQRRPYGIAIGVAMYKHSKTFRAVYIFLQRLHFRGIYHFIEFHNISVAVLNSKNFFLHSRLFCIHSRPLSYMNAKIQKKIIKTGNKQVQLGNRNRFIRKKQAIGHSYSQT